MAYTPEPGGTTYSIPVNNVLLDGAGGAACQQTSSACDDSEETLDIVQAIGMAPGLSQVRLYIGFSDVDILNSMATENIAKQISISWGWSPDDPSTGTSILTMTAASSAPLGTTLTQILGNGGYSGAGNQFFQTVTPTATPTFSVGISPVSMTLAQGASGTATIKITPQNGFTGSVNLTAPYLPKGVTASFSANSTTGTSVVTLTASSTTLPSSLYSVGIAGSSGSIQNVLATLYLQVNPPPGFALSASSSPGNLSQGASATDIIEVIPQTGFTGNVTLSISNLPSGVTAAFGTNPTTGTSLLTLTANCSIAAGNYSAMVSGTFGAQTVTIPLTVTVSSTASCLAVATTTVLSITPSGGTLTSGGSYTLTATVSPASGSTKPSGNVVFTIGSATQTVALNASGVATFTGTAPAAGTLTLSAAYKGTVAFLASTSNTLNETVVVPAVATTTVLSITPSGGNLTTGGSYILTATVSPESGSTKPSGNVVFTIGSATQTVALNASGIATYTGTAPTAAGALTLSAAYSGTPAFLASTSNTLNETITTPPVPTYTVSGTAVTLVAGATTNNTSMITITPSGGFTGSVTLTAAITSSPAGALDPPTLSFGSTTPASISSTAAGTATLTISSTAATSAALAHPRRPGRPWYAAGGGTLLCLLLFGIPRQNRRSRSILGILALLVVLTFGVSACGGGSGSSITPSPSNPGTTAGTYTITVTATSDTTTVIGSVNLTMQ